jgi:hypothetical protein
MPYTFGYRRVVDSSSVSEAAPHCEMNIGVPGNMITLCEGNMSTV